MNDTAQQQICESAWKRARLVAWLLLAAPALYVVVGGVLIETRNLPRFVRLDVWVRDVVFYVFVGASVVDFMAAAALRGGMLSADYVTRRFTSMGQAAQHYGQVHILVGALCEVPALMGLVYLLLTGDLRRMVVCAGAGVLFSLILFPKRATLERVLESVSGRRWFEC